MEGDKAGKHPLASGLSAEQRGDPVASHECVHRCFPKKRRLGATHKDRPALVSSSQMIQHAVQVPRSPLGQQRVAGLVMTSKCRVLRTPFQQCAVQPPTDGRPVHRRRPDP